MNKVTLSDGTLTVSIESDTTPLPALIDNAWAGLGEAMRDEPTDDRMPDLTNDLNRLRNAARAVVREWNRTQRDNILDPELSILYAELDRQDKAILEQYEVGVDWGVGESRSAIPVTPETIAETEQLFPPLFGSKKYEDRIRRAANRLRLIILERHEQDQVLRQLANDLGFALHVAHTEKE